jgi:hypothetical protein
MSSFSGEGDVNNDAQDIANNKHGSQESRDPAGETDSETESFSRTRSPDALESGTSGTATPLPDLNGTSFQGYGKVKKADEGGDEVASSTDLAPLEEELGNVRVVSPGESGESLETPDDTPSIKVGLAFCKGAGMLNWSGLLFILTWQ